MPSGSIASLRAEHAVLGTLLARLSAAGNQRAVLVDALDEFLPRLFQHETREEGILKARLRGAVARALLAKTEGEHLTLRSLVRDIELVQAHPELYAVDHLSRLARRLVDALGAHFSYEETVVFPAAG